MFSAFSFCQKRTIQKSFVWQHFKKFTCKKINTSTQNVVKEELRVYCQHSNCKANYKYRVGGTTRNMSTHLKKHNIFGKDEEEKLNKPINKNLLHRAIRQNFILYCHVYNYSWSFFSCRSK
jgi:tetrahydromethanopterin S-methyltransferase subunit H